MAIKIKKHYIILLLIMFFSCVHFADASLKITEVMYDPEGTDTNREWIKLYNDGNEEINIIGGQTNSAWRVSGGESKESLHYISENLNISAGEYAIITKNKDSFEQEYPSFVGPIATASISFNNTAGIVKIWDGSNPRKVVTSFEYNANNNVSENQENTIEENTDTDSTSVSSTKSTEPIIFKITTKINSPKVVTAGIPFSLSSNTSSNTGVTYDVGKFVWNFGDGMMREVGKSVPFDYVYEYPGEYAVTLSYFDSVFSKTADATSKVTVKVIPSEIFISSVGTSADPFIEIENKSNSEIILSNWLITGGIHYFKIPDGTTVLPNKKIKLSPKITVFTGEDIQFISIINPNKDVVATYPAMSTKKLAQKNTSTYAIAHNDVSSSSGNTQKDSPLNSKDSQIINLNDLSASAGNTETDISDRTYAFVGLFVVIGVGVASFLIFKKRNTPRDYIEGDIRAEDMTIVE